MNNGTQPTILLVDDEEMVLTSLRAFLSLEPDYTIYTYSNPIEALNHLESNNCDVVVTDYLMPQITGLEFLRRVKAAQPMVARVLLTGHADKQSAIQAINEVGLFQYLEKPWDNTQFLLVIKSAVERTRILRDLEATVSELDDAHKQLKEAQRRLIRAFL